MVDWSTVAIAAPGWGVTAYAALALVGKAPMRLRRWDKERIEDEHEKIVREHQLTALAAQSDAILKAVTPNGGGSMMDIVTRVEKKLDDHIASSDRVETAIYEQMAEQGHEIDSLTRRVRDLFTRRGPDAALPTEGI